MASIKLIKRRIKSAQNIAQITRAMEMVAASKMKKAQEAAVSGKPYADKVYESISELSKMTDSSFHRLLSQKGEGDKTLIILITTNKGLCGSLNTNLFRKCLQWFTNAKLIDCIAIGNKGAKFAARAGYNLIADFSDKTPFTVYTGAVIDIVTQKFITGEYKEVIVVYNNFINALNLIPDSRMILPIGKIESTEEEIHKTLNSTFLIEPDPVQLLNFLIPHYLEVQVRAAIIQAEASEHSARMLAMKSATDNALSLSEELTLIYNKLRQEQITYEIADITRSQLSLN